MKAHKLLAPSLRMIAVVAVGLLFSCSSDSNSPNSGGTNNPPGGNAVNIAGIAFSPTNLTIKVGTKVTWTNNDNVTHTVTSDDDAFNSSGNLAKGDTYEYTFNTAGSYPYHCTIHPSMTATITVTP